MRKMKDSGIEWIGEIPEEWETRRIKQMVDYSTPDSFIDGDWIESPYIVESGIRYLTTGNIGDGVFKEQGNGFISLQSFSELNCKYAYPGDLVISRLNAPYGRSCILPHTFDKYILAVDNVIFRPENSFAKEYICYVTQCSGYQMSVCDSAKGTTMKRISRTNLANITMPIPPKREQESIFHYLNRKCSQIDTILDKTRATIEEYKKLKQAVITQAVTKGVRGDRPMKDSGIEWAPEVPIDVAVTSVGKLFDIILGKMLCPTQPDENYSYEPYYCAADIHFDGISTTTERKYMWFNFSEKITYLVKQGDLLVVEGGAGAGGCALVLSQTEPTYIQNSVMIVREIKISSNRYLRYWIEFLVKDGYIDIVCNKATIPHFTKDKLSNTPILLFPPDEIEEIADYLDRKCSKIDTIITKKEQLVTELESYKKSLIYEYVTGKKEVPNG